MGNQTPHSIQSSNHKGSIPTPRITLTKIQIDCLCDKVSAYLDLQSQRQQSQGNAKWKELVTLVTSPNRSRDAELHKFIEMNRLENYVKGVNILIRFTENIRTRSAAILANQQNASALTEILPSIYSLVWAAPYVQLTSLKEFTSMMSGFFGEADLASKVKDSDQVDPTLKACFGAPDMKHYTKEMNEYATMLQKQTNMTLDQINAVGHPFDNDPNMFEIKAQRLQNDCVHKMNNTNMNELNQNQNQNYQSNNLSYQPSQNPYQQQPNYAIPQNQGQYPQHQYQQLQPQQQYIPQNSQFPNQQISQQPQVQPQNYQQQQQPFQPNYQQGVVPPQNQVFQNQKMKSYYQNPINPLLSQTIPENKNNHGENQKQVINSQPDAPPQMVNGVPILFNFNLSVNDYDPSDSQQQQQKQEEQISQSKYNNNNINPSQSRLLLDPSSNNKNNGTTPPIASSYSPSNNHKYPMIKPTGALHHDQQIESLQGNIKQMQVALEAQKKQEQTDEEFKKTLQQLQQGLTAVQISEQNQAAPQQVNCSGFMDVSEVRPFPGVQNPSQLKSVQQIKKNEQTVNNNNNNERQIDHDFDSGFNIVGYEQIVKNMSGSTTNNANNNNNNIGVMSGIFKDFNDREENRHEFSVNQNSAYHPRYSRE